MAGIESIGGAVGDMQGWITAEDDIRTAAVGSVEGPGPGQAAWATGITPPARQRWPGTRVAAVEALWGEGFATPGGASEALRLVKPLGLSPSVTLMLLGGGLGGAAESISGRFGVWVASFEADQALSARAAARRGRNDPHNRISIAEWDRTRPDFKPRSANHVLSLEALRGHPPAPLLAALAAALSPGGQIVLTELVADETPGERDREFAAWCRLDDRQPALPRPQDLSDGLQRLGFDVRVVEDLSDRHVTQTLTGWRDAVRGMGAGPRPAAHDAAAFVAEAELWLLRMRLMRRLGMRLVRWHAIRP